MLDGIKQYLYLVVDRETNLILTRCQNASTANAVCRGFLNSTIMVINRPDFFNNDKMQKYHNDSQITFKLTTNDFTGISSLEANVGEKVANSNNRYDFIEQIKLDQIWLDKRNLANIRSKIFSIIEAKIERYLARYTLYVGDSVLYQYLAQEFGKCDVKNNCYSESILEYSNIMSMSPSEAFNDLKMKYDSFCLTSIRYAAIWEKTVIAINTMKTYSDINYFYADLEAELAGMNRQ